jgi:hypothetical protein
LFEDDDVSDDDWLSKFSDDFLQEQYMLSQMDPEEYREYMETKKIIERNGA